MNKNIPKRNQHIFTPLEEAVEEIKKRNQDSHLRKKVEDFLNGDIPEHFNQEQPIFYLSRHVATPNYEALRCVELAKPFDLPLVIGQDSKGKFVSNNVLKRAAAKLPITTGFTHEQDEIIEYVTIVDFAKYQGLPLSEIVTKNGANFVTYHNQLFTHIYPEDVSIAEEADWVDRNHRDDIAKQYEKMVALLCVHGIMLESYPEEETLFVREVLEPAMKKVEETIGVKPLIVEHIDDDLEVTRDWNGYPSVLYKIIKDSIT